MQKNILMRTILLACFVIIAGFSCIVYMNCARSVELFEQDVQRVSALTEERISHRIDSIFLKPISTAVTIANDTLLRSALESEKTNGATDSFVNTIEEYLNIYNKKYNYDSVFLVSDYTKNYYHFNGISHVVQREAAGNEWYFNFLESPAEYDIHIANDESSGNRLVVFINCKIKDASENILGVVGVGFDINYIKDVFKYYETTAGSHAYLITDTGDIAISTDTSDYKAANLFSRDEYAPLKDYIMASDNDSRSSWYESRYIITRYIPSLKWHLVVDIDTGAIRNDMKIQLRNSIIILLVILLCLLLLIVNIIRRYNKKIVRLIEDKEKSHENLFETAVKKMYDSIFEINITQNRAANEETQLYFEKLGCAPDVKFDDVLKVIAEKEIKQEYRDKYIDTFCTQNIIKMHLEGVETVSCELMRTIDDGKSYYWVRILARIFYWDEDESVRMFVYRQNIDMEMLEQQNMVRKMESDSLTGIYNKAATQNYIHEKLENNPSETHALFIMDIDNFKSVNDTCGHSVGDKVILEFASKITLCFDKNAVIGRIGGDEFIAFVKIPSLQWLEKKAGELVQLLEDEYVEGDKSCHVSSSIGIAVSPEAGTTFEALYKNADYALYQTKKRGKNGFTIFKP